MSAHGPAPNSVAHTRGPVHAGDGPQYNDAAVHTGSGEQNNYYGDAEESFRAAEDLGLIRERVEIRAQWLRTLRSRFVAPPGFDEAVQRERLSDPGYLVLTGEPGLGRRTMAQILLVPRGEEDRGLREVLSEGDGFWTSDDPFPGERLLLDLTGGELGDTRWPERLRRFVGRVADAGARLVVILDERNAQSVPQDLRDHLLRAGRPDPRRVLASHLETAGLPVPAEGGGATRLHAWLDAAGVGEIAELVRRADHALAPCDSARAVAGWIDAVLGAGHDGIDDDLDARDGRARALLFTVAFLEGAGLEEVAEAGAALLERTGGEAERVPIERASFTAELRSLGVTVEHRRVRFADPWRAQVLREVFWDGHPHLHEHVGAWVDRCVIGGTLPPGRRDQAARNWAGQVLRARRPEPLLERARAWSSQGRAQGGSLLVEALYDRDQGIRVRQRSYDWARDLDLPVPFARTLVSLCAEHMVITHADQALVRLRHLAAHPRAEVADDARTSLRGLVRTEPSLFRAQLHALTTVFKSPRQWVKDVHVELFADLVTHPEVSAHTEPDGRAVTETLTALLERVPGALETLVVPWVRLPEDRVQWLVAAAQETGRLGQLYALALRTAPGTADPDGLRRHALGARSLLSLIDRAQGLDPGGAPVKETTP